MKYDIGIVLLVLLGIGAIVLVAWLINRFVENSKESVENIRKMSRHMDEVNKALDDFNKKD